MGKTELLKIVQEMLDTVEPLLEESADAYFIRMDDMYLTKGGEKMLPAIDKKKTGINLRLMMDERGLTVKDVQQYLKLGSIQSVYHWLNGISLPTVDNLYALSYLFQVPVDDLICGNRRRIFKGENQNQISRLCVYYDKINEIRAA